MAVYKSFSASNYAQAAQTAAQYLQETGIFDAVTRSDNVISCTYGGEIVATFTYSSGRIDVTFGVYSVYAADIDTFWIGSAKNGVLLDHHNRFVNPTNYRLYSFAICRSQSGVPMLLFHELGGSGGNSYTLTADAEYAPASEADAALRTNNYYSNLVGVCTIASGASTVAAADKVFRYADRQTNVPIDALSIISIAGTDYLTDGYLAVQD